MKNQPIFILILLLCFGLAGCDQLNELYFPKKKKKAPAARQTIKIIDDMELAQAILKPERKKLEINRDPFKPLITKETAEPSGDNTKSEEDQLRGVINKIKFQGLVTVGGSSSALLVLDKKKGVYQLNDSIDQFRVTEIYADYVVLKKGEFTFQLKRGDK